MQDTITITTHKPKPRNVNELTDLWPSIKAMAEDLGISPITVYSFRHHDAVPEKHWKTLMAKARERGIRGITLQLLQELHPEEAV